METFETPRRNLATQGELRVGDGAVEGTRSIGEMLVQDASRRPGSLKWTLAALRRRWWLFLVVVVATAALAAGYAVVKPPVYTATTQIILDPRTGNDGSYAASGGNGVDPMAVDSQVEMLKSRDIARAVTLELKLVDDPRFTNPSWLSRWLGSQRPRDLKTREQAIVEILSQNLDVHSLGLSSVISVSYRDPSADNAARIANAFARAYIDGQLSVKAEEARQVVNWLKSRLIVLQDNAARSEMALKEYQASNGLFGLQSSTGATLAQQQINAMTIDLSRATDEEAVARAKLQGGLTRSSRYDSIGDTLSSPVIQDLARERNAASARLAQLQSRYGSAHPQAVAEQHGIADIDRRRAYEVERIHRSLQSAVDVATARTASLVASLNAALAAAQKASRASGQEIQLQILANVDNDVYKKSLDRLKQTVAETGTERADARIVSAATSPLKPSSTGRKLIFAGGLLLGCAAGLVVIVGVELLRGGIYNSEQLTDVIRVPWLGSVPELQNRGPRILQRRPPVIDVPVFDQMSDFSEMVRGVAATEPFMVNNRRHRTVMLTSTVAGEGKSTAAIVLGRTMALHGIRVLLVDCDLIKRSVTTVLGPEIPYGLVEVIKGVASLKAALQIDDASGMHWIGIRKESGVAGSFSNPCVPQLLFALRESFDIVLLDAAPLLATADARYLARMVDRLVIAVRWARTRPQGVRATMKVLDEIGVPASGAILTRIDLRSQRRMGDGGRYSYQEQYNSYVGAEY